MHRTTAIVWIAVLVLLNVGVHFLPWRWDMTDDHRYSLSKTTCQWLALTQEPIEVDWCLSGPMNSGFARLNRAGKELLEEFAWRAPKGVHVSEVDSIPRGLPPIVIHERTTTAQTSQTTLYPYAIVHYRGRQAVVELLRQNRGLSGEENLNLSIENLEFAFMEALRTLDTREVQRVAFVEGHGELNERSTYDMSEALSHYYQVDRGVLAMDGDVLDAYKAVIIADPQQPFRDEDKYILDQYLMRGGRILWLLNGVRFSSDHLSSTGKTPIIPLDLNINDMLFRYGVRIRPALVQDRQCLPVPVDVSADPMQPNWQPLPWTYAPLLLTSETSSITRHIMQVSATMASCLEFVGEDDGLSKDVLLATSSASRLTTTPAEVDLSIAAHEEAFPYAYVPVAAGVEGVFTSFFAHQMPPEGLTTTHMQVKKSVPTRQVVVASGSIARNEWQQNEPLPVGYDRYTGTQFGNRDFLVNSVLWLTDDDGWMALRQKSVALRLINDERARQWRTTAIGLSISFPLVVLALVGLVVWLDRRKRYVI